ncbi:class Ib ribonucleoside-diphosphate reductase assembly flavoprotein NrdI [Streptococcus sp. HF-1907]|uniref:class Ib ribonucleoside-diphosphate reductase assembly flavoprotein NrdI n=1 Tax=Streptococcus sp. HF-1907 TaxID=2785793 RepID=UPI00189F01E8|nr:class Ib ribonucleoside-diphosphate reductase assembly flavoprotein NrdI [Streptococcus sp. HF-1907]MBF7093877.1 class Ib ribonucleoside-diphosphate reductase assembly flavoprotein NrdI [Streptococcus sp. HF-1907]
MQTVKIYYISLSGNTTSFLKRLKNYLREDYAIHLSLSNVKDWVRDGETVERIIDEPYFSFLPSYLEGGNGLDTGFQEILTTPLKELIAYGSNRDKCLGIVGSGNRNFNKQYCLTAHQYAESFGFPVIDEFELRGTEADVHRIGDKLVSLAREGGLIK